MATSFNKQFSIAQLVKELDVTIKGDPNCIIKGVCTIQDAKPDHITFLTNAYYRKYLPDTKAAAVILSEDDVSDCKVNAIISHNPHYTYAKIAAFFDDVTEVSKGIHSSVVIGTDSHIHPEASIGPHVVIGSRVKIAAHVVISAGCVIGDDVTIDESSYLDANVTLYHRVKIGKRVNISSGVVIGSDGFGFAREKNIWHKVAQLGTVIIGDDVDIGANTSIDRGAVLDTIIEDGVKLDNLIQIGHNVKIGAHSLVCGCVAIAGSTIIGKNCVVGGAACFAGHLTVCDNVMITGMTAVTKSITEPGVYSSGIVGAVPNHEFRKNNARFHRLENLMQRVKSLEQTLKTITERNEI